MNINAFYISPRYICRFCFILKPGSEMPIFKHPHLHNFLSFLHKHGADGSLYLTCML